MFKRGFSSTNQFVQKNFDQILINKLRVPRIIEDNKLDFKDVLIRPQLTALSSRRAVNLTRKFVFRHHNTTWEGIPIMAANMDTVGTFEIAEEFAKHDMITCMQKHYETQEFINWGKKVGKPVLKNIAIAAGVGDRDFAKVQEITEELPEINFLCLDVANGYQNSFIDRVHFYREKFPTKIILAGNVVT